MSLTIKNQSDVLQLIETDDAPLVENHAGVPVVYVDGIADAEVHGEIVRVTYFEYRTVGGAKVKNPVLEMVRPLRSCQSGELALLIARKSGATPGAH